MIREGSRPVSVITTLLDEADSLDRLIDSLLRQTRPPDEIVVADAGSTDGTRERLASLAEVHPALRVIDVRGDRSTGRNAAIRSATNEAIACIDGGCEAEPTWLENLVDPLDRGADWVAGFYRPEGGSVRSTSIGAVMVYTRDEVDPATFLPSGRSMAFTREAWELAGGFPEGQRFAEDTLFDERMLAAGYRPVFAGDAVVRWQPPSTLGSLARTMWRWGHGDGEAGLRGPVYKRILIVYWGSVLAALIGAFVRPRWGAVGLVPLAAVTVRRTRRKYRSVGGTSRFLWIPIAHLVATFATSAGFLAGRRDRTAERP